jgi:glycogen synthase
VRILTVGNRYPPWSTGGYEVVWSASVRALRSAGHEVRVLTTLSDPSDRRGGPSEDVHRDLRWYWRDHEFPATGFRAAAVLERHNGAVLDRHLREHAADVVVWWAMGGMSLSLIERVRRAGIPAVGLVGDEWMIYGPTVDGWISRWRGWPRPAAQLAARLTGVPTRLDLDRAGSWLFNSRYLLTGAREAGWRLPRAAILPPGIDPQAFYPREAGSWRWRLLYSGRLDRRKGIETAIEGLSRLSAEATLTVTGDGDDRYRSELRSLAAELGVGARVRFDRSEHGAMPEVYAAADAVVFPVIWREPWGLVPLEAMAAGRPVVASRAGGGPAEYLVDGHNCLQFEPGDAAGLADALRQLGGDSQLRQALVAAGRTTALRFTERTFHAGLERELRSVAGTGD